MAKSEWAKTTNLIAVAVSILEREYPMTIRQLFYRIVISVLSRTIAALTRWSAES
jgi:hypothetical protein